MKTLTIKVNSPEESTILQKTLFKAGGTHQDGSTKIKKINGCFFFISDSAILTFSKDPIVFEKRKEFEISLYDAIHYLKGFIKKEPFLHREGIYSNFNCKIDSGIKTDFISMCNNIGYSKEKRIENLIAADIKANIMGLDLLAFAEKMINER